MFPSPILLHHLQSDLSSDLLAFLPECLVAAAVVLLPLLRLVPGIGRSHRGGLALALTVTALGVGGAQWYLDLGLPQAFTGLLVGDNFTLYLRLLILSCAALTVFATLLTGLPDADDSADFYTLLLGATLGMLLMAAANHLLMVFIAIEMASVPSYALAGFLKGRRTGSEAALKYVVYGASASGVMLYGISLLAGKFGTGYLPDLAFGFAAAVRADAFDPALLLGTLFVVVGFGFKLAAVPFHFWCPDVFEGAAAEVAGFLSVASKGAALGLTARVLLALTGGAADPTFARLLVPLLAALAVLTATFGNLAAFAQTNLKRLLAYSTIAHAGYMLMGLATLSPAGAGAVLFYLAAYLFTNVGAFATVALIRNATGTEDISGLRGLVGRCPALTVALAVFLLGLLGLPPLAGFAAKFQLFAVVFQAGDAARAGPTPQLAGVFYALVAVGVLNTVLSAAYYLKVLRVLILDRPTEGESVLPAPRRLTASAPLFAAVVALVTLGIGLAWDPLLRASDQGAQALRAPAVSVPPAERGRVAVIAEVP
jgi:NADH-quinone oxidoreductase subunit N